MDLYEKQLVDTVRKVTAKHIVVLYTNMNCMLRREKVRPQL